MPKTKRAKPSPRRAARGAVAEPAAPPGARAMAVTTVRVFRDQLYALQRLALDRAAGGAGGRADASAVLRDLLDQLGVRG